MQNPIESNPLYVINDLKKQLLYHPYHSLVFVDLEISQILLLRPWFSIMLEFQEPRVK